MNFWPMYVKKKQNKTKKRFSLLYITCEENVWKIQEVSTDNSVIGILNDYVS